VSSNHTPPIQTQQKLSTIWSASPRKSSLSRSPIQPRRISRARHLGFSSPHRSRLDRAPPNRLPTRNTPHNPSLTLDDGGTLGPHPTASRPTAQLAPTRAHSRDRRSQANHGVRNPPRIRDRRPQAPCRPLAHPCRHAALRLDGLRRGGT
jgi:hypothetical protein